MPILEILLYSTIFFFFYLMIMAVLFPRVSIKYIDNKMILDGISSPSWDKGIGASAPFYAMAIFFKRARKPTPLFDGSHVAKYARPIDKFLAFLHLVSTTGFLLSLFSMMILEAFFY
ncbi:hypothetical protein CWC11_06065 [Pseudoalteromonas sp. S3178]|uniref:hypothetical protein n=1 Tax=Pseudoalteromonas sp. S3178 TaxID=579532 RepID=UPI00110B444F|nr:hypothetical protein [Pseudoalteromonas sp. S3178]TMP07597.1 hypothetical protein CWC11_06065 [Pseudoalteromonas sp. S3178]